MPSSRTEHGFVGGNTGQSCSNRVTCATSAALEALSQQGCGEGCNVPAICLLSPNHSALPRVREQLRRGRQGSPEAGDSHQQHWALSEADAASLFA